MRDVTLVILNSLRIKCHIRRPLSHNTDMLRVMCCSLLVARFIDASIYRDAFPAMHTAKLFFLITIFFTMIFISAEKIHNNLHMRFLQSNSSNT